MKTSIQNTLNVFFTLILFSNFVYTQTPVSASGSTIQKAGDENRVCSVIDVKGSRFSDRMWIFSIPQCTTGFDNGWDGFKMFGSSVAPQIYAMEEAGNFQVNSVPDINNTYIGFRAGEDTIYTLTFTNYFVATRYQELYLVDLLENKTINIFETGAQYTFVAKRSDSLEKRFKIISTDIAPVIIPENSIGTIIDVYGSRYNDQLSIFSDSTCTPDFDNGKDTYKTFGSPLEPQLYDMEADGNYQINVLKDINNTNLGFLPGEDTNYTLKITNYNLDKRYTELYLIDLVENKTIDIHTSGTEYSFVAAQTNSPVNRFKIVTSVSKPDENSTPENQYKPDDSNKTLNIFNADKTLVIDNPTASTGDLTIYDAHYGRVVSKLNFNANQITTVQMNLSNGVYVIKGVTQTEVITKRIIVR